MLTHFKHDREALWRTLRLELFRSLFSSRFYFCVALMLAWLSFNALESAGSYSGAVFAGIPVLIRLATTGHISTGPVLLAISTIPYAFSYLTEHESGFQQQVVAKIGQQNYGTCKTIATFFSAFLMGITSLSIFITIASMMGISHTVRYEEVKGSYEVFVETIGVGWYYAARLLHIGLVCGQAAVFSLLSMAWIPNAYVGFLSPLVGYYLYECILNVLYELTKQPLSWRMISADALLAGSTADNPSLNFLWTILLLGTMALCFGMCFKTHLEKELIK